MFARYYNSATGRFLSPDWDAKSSDPVPYAKLDNPQSLNLYSYVLNNPVTTEDPNGHWPAVLVKVAEDVAEATGEAATVIDLTPVAAIAGAGWVIDQVVAGPEVGEDTRGKTENHGSGGDQWTSSSGKTSDTVPSDGGVKPSGDLSGMKPGSSGGPGAGKRVPDSVRQDVLNDNGGKCVVEGCNEPAVHVDHAHARSKGGNIDRANLQGMCAHHNCQKQALSSKEYSDKLKKKKDPQ